MRNFSLVTIFSGCIFLLSSITTIAYENKTDAKNSIIYSINSILDDYVLNYCSTYDSYTVNRLYSQKKILEENKKLNLKNNLVVTLKKKPLNPNIIKLIEKPVLSQNLNQNIDEINLDFLSPSKKNFVKTLLPLISYENQNILLERSKLKNIKEYLENNNTLAKSDLKFLE